MLNRDRTALILIDIQEKLTPFMVDREELIINLVKLTRGCQILNLPIFLLEQYPKGLGPTISPLKSLLTTSVPFEKIRFSACGSAPFLEALKKSGCGDLLVAGIEAHVCVYQSVVELFASKFQPHLVVDAVSSRSALNRDIAVQRCRELGAVITTTEMALFELLREAGSQSFKEISALVK